MGESAQWAHHLYGWTSGLVHCRSGGRKRQETGHADSCWHRLVQRSVERNFFGGEGARAGARGWVKPIRYFWTRFSALLWLWKQVSGEGLGSVLFWSCLGWQLPSRCEDAHKSCTKVQHRLPHLLGVYGWCPESVAIWESQFYWEILTLTWAKIEKHARAWLEERAH